MGCFGSRLDKRASAATEDLNSVGLQFVGGEGEDDKDKQAADRFVMLQGKDDKYECLQTIYPTEAGKATDDKKAIAAYTAAFKFVEKHLGELEAQDKTATKDEMILGKHKRKSCILQLQSVMDSFKKTDIEVAAEVKPLTPEEQKAADDKKAEEAKGEDMNEGGTEEEEAAKKKEEDEKAAKDAMGASVTDPRAAHVDDQEYKGFAETPALYLRNALVNEYFGDLIKQRIVAIQFMGEKGTDTNKELDGAAGYLTSGLATTAEKPATEAWFSGLVGELDEAALGELKKDGTISFPGWVQGWAKKEDADNYLKTMQSDADKKDVKAVIVHVTEAPSITVLGNRIVCHRLSGTVIDEVKSADGITTVNVKASPWDERTAQVAWDASNAAPPAVKELTEEEKKAAADKEAADKAAADKEAADKAAAGGGD